MITQRPLSQIEIAKISENFSCLRDKTMFSLMLYTGFRISEVLSLQLKDIVDNNGTIVDRLTVSKANMKGKKSSRSVIIHPSLKLLLASLVNEKRNFSTYYLFSPKNAPNRSMSRIRAWKILNEAAKKAGLSDKIGLHSTRKTFANQMYEKLGKDILKTSKALGHRNINSTMSYLSFRTEEIDSAVLDMNLGEK